MKMLMLHKPLRNRRGSERTVDVSHPLAEPRRSRSGFYLTYRNTSNTATPVRIPNRISQFLAISRSEREPFQALQHPAVTSHPGVWPTKTAPGSFGACKGFAPVWSRLGASISERSGSRIAIFNRPLMRQLYAVADPPIEHPDASARSPGVLRQGDQRVGEVTGRAVVLELHHILVDYQQVHDHQARSHQGGDPTPRNRRHGHGGKKQGKGHNRTS